MPSRPCDGRIDGDDRSCLGQAEAFDDLGAEPLAPDPAGLRLTASAPATTSRRLEKSLVLGGARIAGEEGVGAEHDGRV